MRTHLLGELATTQAARCRHALKVRESSTEVLRAFSEARQALANARLADPTNYYPIDILAWSSRDILRSGFLSKADSAEVVADVLSAFDTTDEYSLDVTQRERFHTRRIELGEVLDIPHLVEEAFESLERSGSSAGYFVMALNLSGRLAGRARGDRGSAQQKGLAYLTEHRERIKSDVRCLELALDLWWLVHTNERFFAMERQTRRLVSSNKWQELLRLVEDISATGQSRRSVFLGYLRAIVLFHLGYTAQSFEEFREVERESDQISGSRRIVKSYLASTPDGTPSKFHGTVSRLSRRGKEGRCLRGGTRPNGAVLPCGFRQARN